MSRRHIQTYSYFHHHFVPISSSHYDAFSLHLFLVLAAHKGSNPGTLFMQEGPGLEANGETVNSRWAFSVACQVAQLAMWTDHA